MVELTLPWPPSVNGYWRHPTTGKLAGRHLISEAGRAYREAVGWQVAAASMAAGLASLDPAYAIWAARRYEQQSDGVLDGLHTRVVQAIDKRNKQLDYPLHPTNQR